MYRYKGDGWHKIGNCRVYVENHVIVMAQKLDRHCEWTIANVKRWNKERHTYENCGMVTLATLRSGLYRGTMSID